MNMKLFVTLLALLFFLLSCQSKEEVVTREKSLSRGFSLMDKGNYDEAIQYFTELAAKDPHYHVKMALASAYAGRAGVKIEQIYSFIVVKNTNAPEVTMAGLPVNKQTEELLNTLRRFVQQWERVPTVSADRRMDLQSALQVLKEVKEPGARLYAATLRVVVLKSLVGEGLRNWSVRSKAQICTPDLRKYYDWSLRLIDHLVFLSEDLQAAFPEQKKSYEDLHERLGQIKKEAQLIPWPREDQCF